MNGDPQISDEPAMPLDVDPGDLTPLGAMHDASNATVLALAQQDNNMSIVMVYKPVRGTRPLWDFPAETLSAREVLSYELSEASGLKVVPPTFWVDGPLGEGSAQIWIASDGQPVVVNDEAREQALQGDLAAIFGDEHGNPGAQLIDVVTQVPAGWHNVLVVEGDDGQSHYIAHADADELRRLALFDLVTNNADRKIGHIVGCPGKLFGIDNGLTFHEAQKHRTVLWGFAGSPLTTAEVALVTALRNTFEDCSQRSHLTADECASFDARAEALLTNNIFPRPTVGLPNVPWPPW